MTKIKKILMGIGAGLAAIGEAFMLILFFEHKLDKVENEKKDLENQNENKDAALASAKKYQEEHAKTEETKTKVYTDFGSDTSVNAAIDLMHNNEKRSQSRKRTGV